MNRKDAINTFRWRQSIVDCNYKLINSVKKHKENKLKNAGQLNLFSVGLEDDNRKNIDIYDGEIDINRITSYNVCYTKLLRKYYSQKIS